MAEMDFPAAPVVGQLYTNSMGVAYQWNGVAWVVGFYSGTQQLSEVGDIIDQVRVLLQDTDVTSGQYRYPTDTLVMALNQGILDMFRLRPDLFLEQGFIVPTFDVGNLGAMIGIEEQYIPPLVYYVTGLAQLRDDEQNQDARAAGLLTSFRSAILTMSS